MAGLYIHIPFCRSRCIYCAFFSTTLAPAWQDRYVDALCSEMRMRPSDQPLTTIYLGGGTPSLLSRENLQRLFACIEEIYDVSALREVTLECNPDDVTPAFCQTLRLLPVNRVSLGAQTFSDQRLRFLGRRHTAAQVDSAVSLLRQSGICNISIDLMFGFPSQTLAQWEADVSHALTLRPQHLSAYALTIEPGTVLFKRIEKGELKIENEADETSRQMYELLIDRLAAAGYDHYEISNWALPGYRSRHNSSYWHEEPYLGIGAAAHSYDRHSRSWNVSHLSRYVLAIEQDRLPSEGEPIDAATRYNDLVATALRTREGIAVDSVPSPFRQHLLKSARRALQAGLLTLADTPAGTALRLTRQGLFVSDSVMTDLIYV